MRELVIQYNKSNKTQEVNKHIKGDTLNTKGLYFKLDPDFEGTFKIKVAEFDDKLMKNKYKPFYAFIQFFGACGEPKEAELENLKSNNKFKTIFYAIFEKNLIQIKIK